MPKIDKELKAKGYIPVLASLVYKAVSSRKEGYLEAVTSKAVTRDGIFYLLREDYNNIRDEYNDKPNKRNVKTYEASGLEIDIAIFLDEAKACPRDEWISLRGKYIEELSNRKQEGCSNCQLNSIKTKYKSMLLKKNYE